MRNSFIRLLPYTMVVLAIVTIAFVGYDVYKSNQKPVGLETSIALSRTSGKAYVNDEEIELLITGQNYGELTCESNNEKVATCDIDGTTLLVLPGEKSGSVTITLKESNQNVTADYKLIVSEKDVVDNKNDKEEDKDKEENNDKEDVKEEKPSKTASLSLQYAYGNITFGEGKTVSMKIYGSNYGTLSCSSSNSKVATCKISGTNLIITTIAEGTATITVNSTSGKKDSYKATIIKKTTTSTTTPSTSTTDVTLTLKETSGVTAVGGKALTTTIGGKDYGVLSCSTSNRNTALCAINGNELKITPQNVPGIVTLTIKEANANKTVTYTVTVLRRGETEVPTLNLSSTEGITSGGIITVDVIGTNNGTLECSSANSNIATCEVKNNKLYISPKKDGETVITVKESKVGISVSYKVKVQHNYECLEGTLTVDSSKGANSGGNICVISAELKNTCSEYSSTNYLVEQWDYCIEPESAINYVQDLDDAKWGRCSTSNKCIINSKSADCEQCHIPQSSTSTTLLLPGEVWGYYSEPNSSSCAGQGSATTRQHGWTRYFECKTYSDVYSCPSGWSTYSGSGSSLKCYRAATSVN